MEQRPQGGVCRHNARVQGHVEFEYSWQLGYFGASVELYSVLDTTNDGTINFEESSAKIHVVCQQALLIDV